MRLSYRPLDESEDACLPVRREQQSRYREKLTRALGRIAPYLEASDVIEIMLNPDGALWVERGGEMRLAGTMPAAAAEELISTVAAGVGAIVTYDAPTLECDLPFFGSRFSAMIAPGTDGPTFTIRQRPNRIWTLADYERDKVITALQAAALHNAIAARHNILVAGGTGSGKTTLLNALIAAISDATADHRLIIIEDTPEIQCAAPNCITFRANEAVAALTMQRLLRSAMRHRPDRIIVGEVRGGEALTLIKAWNTGHPGGLATIHANSAVEALHRLQNLAGEATAAPMQRDIAAALNLVVFIARAPKSNETPAGRRVEEVAQVVGVDGNTYQIRPIKEA